MESLGVRILDLLKRHPGLSDREITDVLFRPGGAQQPVNYSCHKLEQAGLLIRRTRADGRIGNRLTDAGDNQLKADGKGSQETGDKVFSEDKIKQNIEVWLNSKGWRPRISWGKTRGIDIEARKGSERWVIEVKGHGSRTEMRLNYFLAVLGETLQQMDDPFAKYSIALPDINRYRRLWDRLPDVAKARTTLTALFVNERGAVYETEPSKRAFASAMGADDLFVQRTALGLIDLEQKRYSPVEALKRRLGDV